MKIVVFGHWSDTGFGVVTQQLSRRFVEAGHDVRVIAVNYRGEPVSGIMSDKVWPANIKGEAFGGNISHEAITGEFWQEYDKFGSHWKPEVALMIADAGTLRGYLGKPREPNDAIGPFGRLIPAFNYVPIEGDNLNPSWRDYWEWIKPIAMSWYGAGVIGAFLGKEVPMIYHGVDTEAFYPAAPNEPIRPAEGVTVTSKEQAKAGAGLDPNRLVMLRCDRLCERKQYHTLIQSIEPVLALRPDVDMVIHCHPFDDGLNLYEEVARLPQQFWPRIRLTGAHDTWNGLSEQGLCALYNAADIYLSPTAGEGFGLTLAEAMSCEVPVVTTDYSACREVVGEGGILVPPLRDERGSLVKIHSKYGMDWVQPDPQGFTAAIMRLLERPAMRRELGKAGRMHVRKHFNWDNSAVQFLAQFEQAIAEKKEPEPVGV